MSENSAEKRHGFERWVASLKLGSLPASTSPPADAGADGSPLSLDEQATLINRLPKEVIYKLRERDSQRTVPKADDSTAVFTPPPELLARARRLQAPPKPERASSAPEAPPPSMPEALPRAFVPDSPPPPSSRADRSGLSASEAEVFANLAATDEEATTYYRPRGKDVPSSPVSTGVPSFSTPAALEGDVSRPGDIRWIDGLSSEVPPAPSAAPEGSSIAPAERRVRWVALVVALVLLAGIYVLSRVQ